jgi:hypothetical protein
MFCEIYRIVRKLVCINLLAAALNSVSFGVITVPTRLQHAGLCIHLYSYYFERESTPWTSNLSPDFSGAEKFLLLAIALLCRCGKLNLDTIRFCYIENVQRALLFVHTVWPMLYFY